MNRRTIATPISLLVVAALVAACGGTQSTTPITATPVPSATATPTPAVTPSPTPTPTPSPTPPADVARLFTAHIIDPSFQGAGPISGSMSLGNLEVPISGYMQIDGSDSALEMTIDVPGASITNAMIDLDGIQYTSTANGPWFVAGSGAQGSSGLGGTWSQAALTVRDEGVVAKLGQRLHRLVPAAGGTLTAEDLDVTDPSVRDFEGSLEFYARDDGSLAVMSISASWTLDKGSGPMDASMTYELSFNEHPTVTIQAPEQVWTMFSSKRQGYSIGYPEGWTLVKGKGNEPDLFYVSASQFGSVIRERQPKAAAGNLDVYVRAFKAADRKNYGLEPERDEPTTLLGGRAHRLASHYTFSAGDVYGVFTLVIRGRNGYAIGTFGPPGYEAETEQLHDLQISTFTLGS